MRVLRDLRRDRRHPRSPVEWRCGQTADLRAIIRLMLTQPGDLHVDVPPCSVRSWQVVRVPRDVVEREAVKQGLTPPVVLGARVSADPPAIAAFVDLHHLIRETAPPWRSERCSHVALKRSSPDATKEAIVHSPSTCRFGGARIHAREALQRRWS